MDHLHLLGWKMPFHIVLLLPSKHFAPFQCILNTHLGIFLYFACLVNVDIRPLPREEVRHATILEEPPPFKLSGIDPPERVKSGVSRLRQRQCSPFLQGLIIK